MSFQEDLAAAKEAPARTEDVVLEVNGHKHRFRFRKLDGQEYAEETLKHPPRVDVKLDMAYGYNLNSLSASIAPRCAVRIEGDAEVEMSPEEWADLLAVVDGGGAQSVANAVFSLNEYASAKAVQAARKALNG